mmetsp:Transcript_19713/g.27203  ORF Transcript_19713/g.27203 Transcript_19713/m.27203 type:complete len:304 (+) Transcript_19713:32-943(+)
MADDQKVCEEHGYLYSIHHGVHYPPGFSSKNIDELKERMKLRTGDVVIATHPKCGTTWMQQITLLLTLRDKSLIFDPLDQSMWPEQQLARTNSASQSLKNLNDQKGRRILKTHAPAHLVPWNGEEEHESSTVKPRILVVNRNPLDASVSMFHHSLNISDFEYTGPWDHFQQIYLDGKVESGDYWDFYDGWWEEHKKTPENIMWVNFEDLKSDLKGQVKKIAKFLEIECDEEFAEYVATNSTFEAMKKQAEIANAEKEKKGGYVLKDHIRKGKVGGWKAYFSEEQMKDFREKHQKVTREWRPEI